MSEGDASPQSSAPPASQRLLFLDALRAFASLTILWHHFALYPPLREWAAPPAGGLLDWFQHHARATQVFFVVGGYVMARGMEGRRWNTRRAGGFLVQRYFRLGLPYLAVIALILPIYLIARGWLPDAVVGSPVSAPQLLAHLFFLQDILGYEQLSAGLWFICINFQLGMVYVACLWLRDRPAGRIPDAVGVIGWPLAAASLFWFNLHGDWECWAPYFFPYFFMGIVVWRSLRGRHAQAEFWIYQILLVAAMWFEWRWRLVSAVVVGGLLFGAEKTGFMARWPRSRVISVLGRISYSLFLVHFPVLVLVSTVWTRCGWNSPPAALAGLLAAFVLSLAAALAFHRLVEIPAGALARRTRSRE